MSIYFPSFNYKGFNSLNDKNLIVVAFDADSGEMDTFLGMDPIYTESAFGTKRIDYGAKYNSVAVLKISMIKANGTEFSMSEVRDVLKWTTGSRTNSYLDLVAYNTVQCSFLGRVTAAYQQKVDARTVGIILEFTSISPWAYSAEQYVSCALNQSMNIDENGVLHKIGDNTLLDINANGVLYNNSLFDIDNGIVYIDNSPIVSIDNLTDDLYTPIYLNTIIRNGTSDFVFITNTTTGEETCIYNMAQNEVVTLVSEQFILSDIPGKIFGNNFNFVWPKLIPGVNEFSISSNGSSSVEFTYRYPIKLGNGAIDTEMLLDMCGAYVPSNNDVAIGN